MYKAIIIFMLTVILFFAYKVFMGNEYASENRQAGIAFLAEDSQKEGVTKRRRKDDAANKDAALCLLGPKVGRTLLFVISKRTAEKKRVNKPAEASHK